MMAVCKIAGYMPAFLFVGADIAMRNKAEDAATVVNHESRQTRQPLSILRMVYLMPL